MAPTSRALLASSGLPAGRSPMSALPSAPPPRHPALFEAARIRALGDGDIVVLDGFLGERARAAAAAARALDAAGALTPAAMGRDRVLRQDLRGDRTGWFGELDLPPALHALWQEFDVLREDLNAAAWLGLRRFELQLSCYPGDGARYAAHVDTFAGDPSRRVTAICYLNPDWDPADGGALRAWTPRGVVEVEPQLDRLVVFLSDRVRHEVLPCRAPRFAATAWLRGAEAVPLLPDRR